MISCVLFSALGSSITTFKKQWLKLITVAGKWINENEFFNSTRL